MKIIRGLVRPILILAVITSVLMSAGILLIDFHISGATKPYLYASLKAIPARQVALVLGTSKYVGKRPNQFYSHRIEATAQLYQAGKIDALLISGDNASRYYNEPITMQRDLIKLGIPAAATTLDYAGFRTFDSVVRAQEVFGRNHLVIISQRFHLQRAVYIARHYGIDAIGFVAKDADQRWHWRVRLREAFARVKMWLDLYVLDVEPRFLGDKIEITLPEGPQQPLTPLQSNTH